MLTEQQQAWEVAKGLRGYAGSPAQLEDRRAAAEASERTRIAMDVLRAHGYRVTAQAVPGGEYAFSRDMEAAMRKVIAKVDWVRSRFGTRGLSRSTLRHLHESLPEPAWGVRVQEAAR